MAGAPEWKVYDASGNYQAACKEPEAAAALASFYGDDATIRAGHAKRDVVFTEGESGSGKAIHAYDSFDVVAELCVARRNEHRHLGRNR